jgi:hypothetical protein
MNASNGPEDGEDMDPAGGPEHRLPADLERDAIGVSGKIRVAIEAIAFEGCDRREAAQRAGLDLHSLRTMLSQSRYLKALERALQVRRTLERPRNLQRAIELRDQERHLPTALAAVRFLEGEGERGGASGGAGSVTVNVMSPGWIIQPPAARMQANPLIDLTLEPRASDDGDDSGE